MIANKRNEKPIGTGAIGQAPVASVNAGQKEVGCLQTELADRGFCSYHSRDSDSIFRGRNAGPVKASSISAPASIFLPLETLEIC